MARNNPDPSARMIERFDEILNYLRTKTDTQAGFFAAIESQKADLRFFGARFAFLLEENRELFEAMALPNPDFTVSAEVSNEPFYNETIVRVEYRLPQQFFKFAVSSRIANAWRHEPKTRRKLRWLAYMAMCRSLRQMLDRALHEAKI